MKSAFIKINGIKDAMDFTKKAISTNGDILIRKGRFCVDAKSILGIFSLDLSEGVVVEYPEDAIDFENYINKYKVS